MKYFFLTLFFISYLISFSQEKEKKSPFSGNFDLGLNITKNTESTLQFNNIFLVKYKIGSYQLSLTNNITFISKTGEDDILNKGEQNLRYELIKKGLNFNVNAGQIYDISRNIKNRFTGSAGFSYSFKQKKEEKLNIGISYQIEKETTIEELKTIQSRINSELKLVKKLSKSVEISFISKHLPNIEKFSDFRWESNFSLRLKLSSHFLLSINSSFNYDSFPEADIPEMDYQLINSISYTF